ncbi:MAG: ATP/GTP-binding protein [Candidatus Bathyarchaeia archaeon]
MNVFVLGPAGSGKTLFVKNFSVYLINESYRVKVVNLDPGVLNTGYKPDFDIRSLFTVEGIMRESGLGPNGAILEAMSKLVEVDLPKFDGVDFTLFDTPGQLEPFLFRDTGRIIISKFSDACCLFLGDLQAMRWNLVSFFLYALAAHYILETETIAVLNKVDLLSDEEVNEAKKIIRNPKNIIKRRPSGVKAEMDMEFLRALEQFFPPKRVPLISAKTGENFSEVLTILYEIKCVCGDLT